jgi:membrane protein DedA with SNARE-associated domain
MTFYYFGQRVLQKWPNVISASKLTYLTARVSNQDRWSIYIGRLIPFIRGYTAVAAGLLQIPPRIFLPAVLLSALTWSGGYVMAGKLLGNEYARVVSKLETGKVVLAGLALLLIISLLWPHLYRWLKNRRIHTPGQGYARDDATSDQG